MSLTDKETALQKCSDPLVSTSYGPFRIFGALDADSHTQVYSLASGIRIALPGTQIIGHVMDSLPMFPEQ